MNIHSSMSVPENTNQPVIGADQSLSLIMDRNNQNASSIYAASQENNGMNAQNQDYNEDDYDWEYWNMKL